MNKLPIQTDKNDRFRIMIVAGLFSLVVLSINLALVFRLRASGADAMYVGLGFFPALLYLSVDYSEWRRRISKEAGIDRRICALEKEIRDLREQVEAMRRELTVRLSEMEKRISMREEAPDPINLYGEDDWDETK